jgi:alpha-1,3-mannosyltransferase
VFARSLHYQFYCWYFHSLPLLLVQTSLPVVVKVLVMVGIEVAFNVYPATWWSSLLLQVCHLILLAGLYFSNIPYNQGVHLVKEYTHKQQ